MSVVATNKRETSTPLERYRWRQGLKIGDLARILGWSLYKTRAILRGDRTIRSEEITHISVKTAGEVDAVHWSEWAKLSGSTSDDTNPPVRLGRMPAEGGSRAKGKPVSVVLYKEHLEHLKRVSDRDGVSFSAVIRNIVDQYFQNGEEDGSEPLVLEEETEQSSTYHDVVDDSPIYDDELISKLVEEQGESLNFDEDDVRRFLDARKAVGGEG